MPDTFTQTAVGEYPPPVILVGKVLLGGKSELTKKMMPYEVYRRFYGGIKLCAPKRITCLNKNNTNGQYSYKKIESITINGRQGDSAHAYIKPCPLLKK